MKKIILFLSIFYAAAINGQIITTVAGCATSGFNGSSGLATTIALDLPLDIAIDDTGNLYVADDNNNRVCKVNTAGFLTTFAGSGSYAYSGDNGPAITAGVRTPAGLAVDAFGNLFISDGTSRIRKVNSSGVITTIAGNGTAGFSGDGGLATNAKLSSPYGLAFDVVGNLYIADNSNHRIRKVDTSGIISTFAGLGGPTYSGDGGQAIAAGLNYPTAIACDKGNNLYIADRYNNCIRKVNSLGIITTIAGNGTAGYSGDGGQATNATMHYPSGVAVDSSGNIYIAHYWNNIIRKINSNGIISTFAGGGSCGSTYCGDGGLATNAELNSPYGLKVSKTDNLYITDFVNSRIRMVNNLANSIEQFPVDVSQIFIFPNPTTNHFFIDANTTDKLIVDLFDINGRLLLSKMVNNKTNIDVTDLSEGVYTLSIKTVDLTVNKKLVIIH